MDGNEDGCLNILLNDKCRVVAASKCANVLADAIENHAQSYDDVIPRFRKVSRNDYVAELDLSGRTYHVIRTPDVDRFIVFVLVRQNFDEMLKMAHDNESYAVIDSVAASMRDVQDALHDNLNDMVMMLPLILWKLLRKSKPGNHYYDYVPKGENLQIHMALIVR